jgi:hypothetical protein
MGKTAFASATAVSAGDRSNESANQGVWNGMIVTCHD